MPLKMKVWTVLDIALRVPPIFLIDRALKYEFPEKIDELLPENFLDEFIGPGGDGNNFLFSRLPRYIIGEYGVPFLQILLYSIVILIAILVFIFNARQLLAIYFRIASAAIIFIAYKINIYNAETSNPIISECYSVPKRYAIFIETLAIQAILGLLFSFTNSTLTHSIEPTIPLFCMPAVSSAVGLPAHLQKMQIIGVSFYCIFLQVSSIWFHGLSLCGPIQRSICFWYNLEETYGIYTLIETQCIGLHIPPVLRAFWILKISEYLIEVISKDFLSITALELLRGMIIHGSENIIALLGMASMISIISQFFGYSIQKFLQVTEPSEKNIGNISAMLFILLSLQTGITGLNPDERYDKISRNLCLLYTALLHFIFNTVEPILMSLSASRNPNISKHIRALIITSLLIITPAMILTEQWKNGEPNTWLFALTSFMIELIFKSIVLIIIYILFMVDTYKDGLWENFDDYVFCLKGLASLTEFTTGIYLLVNGFWILFFESTGAIRACMMCLHAYFNIWVEGRRNWQSFLHRRSAQQKINFLQEATKEQLIKNNDVCAICFQDLKTARVTKCNHFYHSVCLRKWLNVQDICPICSTTLCTSSEEKQNQ